jgi:hypothetical protein
MSRGAALDGKRAYGGGTTMRIGALIAGGLIVGVILWDAFETIVLPRTVMRKLRMTRFLYRFTWSL